MAAIEELKKIYKFHEETLQFFQKKNDAGFGSYMDMPTVEEARELKERINEHFAGTVNFDGISKDFNVPTPYNETIPVTAYRSKNCNLVVSPPILVYFHGGGNVLGSRKTHDALCKIIARDSPCVVVNVEYRLAPEHKFPANHDDAICVLRWVNMNKSLVGAVNESCIGVGGDSAGGRIAAVAAHEVPDIKFQILIYPKVDFSKSYPSDEEFKSFPGLSQDMVNWFYEKYLYDGVDNKNLRLSPILHDNFNDLPPAFFVVAELDMLRDGVHAYYEKMKKCGATAQLFTVKGVVHGFISMPGHFKESSKFALEKICKFIKNHS